MLLINLLFFPLSDIKKEALLVNEHYRECQTKFFFKLNYLKDYYNSLIRLFDQTREYDEDKKHSKKAFEELDDWQRHLRDVPKSVPKLDSEALKMIDISLRTWKFTQEEVS